MVIISWKDLVVYKGFEVHLKRGSSTAIMNIYWRDSRFPAGYGPFESVTEALKHYYKTKNN